jgi:hypothetical protein
MQRSHVTVGFALNDRGFTGAWEHALSWSTGYFAQKQKGKKEVVFGTALDFRGGRPKQATEWPIRSNLTLFSDNLQSDGGITDNIIYMQRNIYLLELLLCF